MARNKIICIACGLALPDSFTQEHAPYIWGIRPSPEQFLTNFTGYVVNSLLGKKAEFAGDPAMHEQERMFGVVHFEQDPPVFTALDRAPRASAGPSRATRPRSPRPTSSRSASSPSGRRRVIAKMKAEGVTTVIFLGDPLMPIYLTQQATAQDYHPEWLIAGTVFTDTTTLGPALRPGPVAPRLRRLQPGGPHPAGDLRAPTSCTSGTSASRRWRRRPSAVILPPLSQLFLGIHLAGPDLTPETFQAGLFKPPGQRRRPDDPADQLRARLRASR